MRTAYLLLAVGACGGGPHTDIKSTLKIGDRSDAEIARLISAAGGTDMFGAEAQADQFSSATGACPVLAVSGRSVTLTGGCTTSDGVAIAGSATLTNPIAFDQVQYDFSAATTYSFAQLSLT